MSLSQPQPTGLLHGHIFHQKREDRGSGSYKSAGHEPGARTGTILCLLYRLVELIHQPYEVVGLSSLF